MLGAILWLSVLLGAQVCAKGPLGKQMPALELEEDKVPSWEQKCPLLSYLVQKMCLITLLRAKIHIGVPPRKPKHAQVLSLFTKHTTLPSWLVKT